LENIFAFDENGADTVDLRRGAGDAIQQFENNLLEIAERLASARSSFDAEDMDGETVYLAINAGLAEIIRSVVTLSARQRSEE
jgi:hypothetical protein